jgi:hypothetical protein
MPPVSTVTVMAGYLGTYPAYVEPSGLPWPTRTL